MASSVASWRGCLDKCRMHLFCLFTPLGEKEGLAVRISTLLLVPVSKNDGLPQFICRQCKDAALGIERKLKALQHKAKKTFYSLSSEASIPVVPTSPHSHSHTHANENDPKTLVVLLEFPHLLLCLALHPKR